MVRNLTKEEYDLCHQIAVRAEKELGFEQVTVFLDTSICHSEAHALKLEEYLNAPAGDFAHDVWGINQHLDHNTHKLTDLFCPRYAKPLQNIEI